jgi:mannitol-specific phosphotransferase system IIBC component
MVFVLRSLKGLAETVEVMSAHPKQIFVLASGLTGIFTTGYAVSQIPAVIIQNVKNTETTKQIQETTKQVQETTKQIQETTKQMEQTTLQMQCELETLKLKKRWWLW